MSQDLSSIQGLRDPRTLLDSKVPSSSPLIAHGPWTIHGPDPKSVNRLFY